MSYIANILQVETRQKFSKCPQGAPEWKKNSKFSKIFYFYPKLLKIAFGIIVSSSDNYGLEWVNGTLFPFLKTCESLNEPTTTILFLVIKLNVYFLHTPTTQQSLPPQFRPSATSQHMHKPTPGCSSCRIQTPMQPHSLQRCHAVACMQHTA